MQYIYETHCHTDETSFCGKVPAKETASLYKEAGYSGIVITDHFHADTFRKNGLSSWDEIMVFHMRGYNIAKELEDNSFRVFYGAEIRFSKECDNDYLIFGETEKFLREHPYITDLDDYDDFYKLANEAGLLVFQAHPFRNNMKLVKPSLLDGIEVFNGNKRHDSRNDISGIWANRFGLLPLSGSDFHQYEDFARGGIVTETFANNINELCEIIRTRNYSLKAAATPARV